MSDRPVEEYVRHRSRLISSVLVANTHLEKAEHRDTRGKSLEDNMNKYCGRQTVDWNSDGTFL